MNFLRAMTGKILLLSRVFKSGYRSALKQILREPQSLAANRNKIINNEDMGTKVFRLAISNLCQGDQAPLALQVGASNGMAKHDIYDLFCLYRLKGVLLEPQSEPFRELCKNYGNLESVCCVNAALAADGHEKTIYRVSEEFNAGRVKQGVKAIGDGIASLDKDHVRAELRRHLAGTESDFEVDTYIAGENVKCISVERLREEYHIEKVEILLVDTEGYDFEILKMIMGAGFRPTVICYEYKHLKDMVSESWEFLIKRGYTLFLLKSRGDIIALSDAFVPR